MDCQSKGYGIRYSAYMYYTHIVHTYTHTLQYIHTYVHIHTYTHTYIHMYLTMAFETDYPVVSSDPDRLHVPLMPEPGGAYQPQDIAGDHRQEAHHGGHTDDERVVQEAEIRMRGCGCWKSGRSEPQEEVKIDGR